jgi:hypothetical protein
VAAIIFADQAQKYLTDLATRKRQLVSPARLNAFRTNIKRVLPVPCLERCHARIIPTVLAGIWPINPSARTREPRRSRKPLQP